MVNLENVPTPGHDCTVWRNVSPVGDGWYRKFDNGSRIQFAYPDGQVLVVELDG